MRYPEVDPADLLATVLEPRTGSAPPVWSIGREQADVELSAFRSREDTVSFDTSGSTGTPRRWHRTTAMLLDEVDLLADLVESEGTVDSVVAFAPPVHIYGALASVLLPARLAVPSWFRTSFAGGLPPAGTRPLLVATPWIFTLLLQHPEWTADREHVTVLHSSAMLPESAHEVLAAAGGKVSVVELLGSTETGGLASRRLTVTDTSPWTLFPDVEFDTPTVSGAEPAGEAEVELVVRSPRLATPQGGPDPVRFSTGDLVQRTGERTFRWLGRSSRLVKVNGRRINLDLVENRLLHHLDCADLTVRAVADPLVGEQIELSLVPSSGSRPEDVDLSAVTEIVGVRPRAIHFVATIPRSATGKVVGAGATRPQGEKT